MRAVAKKQKDKIAAQKEEITALKAQVGGDAEWGGGCTQATRGGDVDCGGKGAQVCVCGGGNAFGAGGATRNTGEEVECEGRMHLRHARGFVV
jgi:hypothetical protein